MDKRVVDILPLKRVEEKEAAALVEKKLKTRFPLPKVVFLIPFLILGGVIAYFTLAEAKIEVWPELNPLNFETKITVDKTVENINLDQKILPGFIFETTNTLSEEFLSSGKKTLEKKAEGTIRVYNNSSVSQTLIKNTRFQPPLEKFQIPPGREENPWFRLEERVIISPKSFKDVKVVADSPGEKYNIKPSKFSIPGLSGFPQYTLVYGESFEPFSGGEKKEYPQVLSEDLARAKETLSQKAKREGLSALQNEIAKDYLFLTDAFGIEILEDSFSVKAGAELERFSYKVVAKSLAFTFKKEDLDKLTKGLILDRLPQGKEIDEGGLKMEYPIFSIDKGLDKMILSLSVGVNIFSALDESSLKKGLLGKSLEEAKLLLEKEQGIQKIKIHLWPFWLKSIPKDIQKINLELRLD